MELSTNKHNKSLIILLIFTFFMVIGFEMIMPLIIGHYVNNLKFIATKVAFALAARKFFQQGLAMVGGILADRKDIKILIIMGMLLRVVGFVLLGYSNDFVGLLASMILIGFGGVLFETPYQTAIASLTTEENRSKYYSINNTVVGIASTIGPLLGAILLRYDFKMVCYGAAICFFINFILSVIAMPSIVRNREGVSIKTSFTKIKSDKRYMKFVFLLIVFWLAASQIDISFPLKIQEISGKPESVSWMYAIYAAITAILQYPLVSLLLKKYKPRQIVVFGIFIICLAIFLVPLAESTTSFLLIVALFTIGMLLARPNQQSMSVSLADPKSTGLYLGFNYLGFALGSGFGTIMGGVLFDISKQSGLYRLPWYIYALIATISMAGFIKSKDLGEVCGLAQ